MCKRAAEDCHQKQHLQTHCWSIASDPLWEAHSPKRYSRNQLFRIAGSPLGGLGQSKRLNLQTRTNPSRTLEGLIPTNKLFSLAFARPGHARPPDQNAARKPVVQGPDVRTHVMHYHSMYNPILQACCRTQTHTATQVQRNLHYGLLSGRLSGASLNRDKPWLQTLAHVWQKSLEDQTLFSARRAHIILRSNDQTCLIPPYPLNMRGYEDRRLNMKKVDCNPLPVKGLAQKKCATPIESVRLVLSSLWVYVRSNST